MRRYFTPVCAMAVALLTSCASTPPVATDTHDADVKAIKDDETAWAADFAAKDVDKLVAHYSDDAVVMVPGMPATNGKEAARKSLKEMVSDPAFNLKFEVARVDVSKSGDMGYAQGPYTLGMTDPATKKAMNDKGSWVTVFKKQADGSWKAAADIATSEMPPGGPPPAK